MDRFNEYGRTMPPRRSISKLLKAFLMMMRLETTIPLHLKTFRKYLKRFLKKVKEIEDVVMANYDDFMKSWNMMFLKSYIHDVLDNRFTEKTHGDHLVAKRRINVAYNEFASAYSEFMTQI